MPSPRDSGTCRALQEGDRKARAAPGGHAGVKVWSRWCVCVGVLRLYMWVLLVYGCAICAGGQWCLWVLTGICAGACM